jgi:hypothetical protein
MMVWGMSMPSGFGEFWPLGNAEGVDKYDNELWGERLRLHYLAQTPDEQRRLYDHGDKPADHGAPEYSSYVTGKFICERGAPANPAGYSFSPVEPLEAPKSFLTQKTHQKLGSLIKLNNRILAVDAALKAIIERLEPGVHQFFPMDVIMPRGRVYPRQYYTIVIGQYLDSFSPENSKKGSWNDYAPEFPDVYSYESSSKGISGLALSKAVFCGAHLWRERRFTGLLTCFSDELQGEIAKAGLRIPRHYRMKAV